VQYRDLLEKVGADLQRLVKIVYRAGLKLYALAKEASTESTYGEQQEQGNGRVDGVQEWHHGQDERRPEEYCYGPLTGKLKSLAEAICPIMGYEADRRALRRLGADGAIWIVQRRAQFWVVYFKDHMKWAEIHAKDMELRRSQQQKRSQKKQRKT
jgi:hypothetical protein